MVEVESEYGPAPGYICKCESIQSEISQSLTVAISSVYQKIVNKETKFSGPAVMGFDTPFISEILFQDIPFQAYVVSLEKLRIWILCIGRPNKSEWNFAGTGYKAAFIYTYKKTMCIFEELDDDECKLTIYSKQTVIENIFINIDPNTLWKHLGYL